MAPTQRAGFSSRAVTTLALVVAPGGGFDQGLLFARVAAFARSI